MISKHMCRGYISKATPGGGSYLNRWFLSLYQVLNPNNWREVRVFFDRTASYNGSSINEALLQCPDMASSVVDVLMRFCRYAAAV